MTPAKKLLTLLLIVPLYYCFFGTSTIFAQYHFDSWTTDEGLPQNGVRDIAQTPDGYLWFTTFDGLVRFDGVKFTTFGKGNTDGITSSRFTSLEVEKDGTLYAASMDNGSVTVYRKGKFSSYSSAQVPGDYIRMMKAGDNGKTRFLSVTQKDDSTNWYYLEDGKFVLDKNSSENKASIEYLDKAGDLWKITSSKIHNPRTGKTVTYSHHTNKSQPPIERFEDKQGSLWLSGTSLVRIIEGKIENLSKKKNFPPNSDFHSFWQETDGSIWFANGGRTGPGLGLVRFKNGKFDTFGENVGLSDSSIFDVFKDREGTIWIATNKGINRLRNDVIRAYNDKDGLTHSEVYPLYKDSMDTIWIGSIKGLSIFKNGKFTHLDLNQATSNVPDHIKWKKRNMSVQSIHEDSKGKMWIGVNGGIFIVENGEAEMLKESEGHHTFSIKEDRSGNIWAATDKGVLRLNEYKVDRFYSTKDGLPNRYMTTILEDSKGRLWFGGLGGLSEYKNGKFINFSTENGLAGNHVRTIYEDSEGLLWIGTYDQGLSRFKNGKFTNYSVENGLYNNGVFAIEEDKYGNFWVSSNGGIYRVNRHQLNDLANGRISKVNSLGYGKEDGMLSNECNGGRQPASITDKDGNFWFPTQDGVVVIDPNREIRNSLPPSVVIESASVEREPIEINGELTINPGQKNLEIHYTGISLIKSKQVKFKYKLEGHDQNWIDAGTRRVAYYSSLSPGKYRFRVKAANSDGIWNKTGAILKLEQQPFFYQTMWFYLVCIGLAALLLLCVWKISVHQLEARERLLRSLVAERTAELKSANKELEKIANSDGLTSIGNRRRFEEFLAGEWHRATRFKTEISLVMLDIDHFKLFNDNYGHLAGDECLKMVADALNQTIHRPTDLVARFGGEEFAIILGGTDLEGALTIAQEAFESVIDLKIQHETSDTANILTVSMGVATTFAEMGQTEEWLIKEADEALYDAKASGRNQIICRDLTSNALIPPVVDHELIDAV